MKLSKLLWHLFIIAVFTALSYLLTHSIAVGNILGIVLAIVSLIATIIFLYLLPKLYEQPGSEEETA
jgi:peptidoglycan/LPS O-acetylase OafA/YrhL